MDPTPTGLGGDGNNELWAQRPERPRAARVPHGLGWATTATTNPTRTGLGDNSNDELSTQTHERPTAARVPHGDEDD